MMLFFIFAFDHPLFKGLRKKPKLYFINYIASFYDEFVGKLLFFPDYYIKM